jgi:sialidase-1
MQNTFPKIIYVIAGLLSQPIFLYADTPKPIDLFTAGEGTYAHYRIPGLVVSPGGAILAYCEARGSVAGDWSKTDLLFRRSIDGGATWSPAKILAKPPTDARQNPVVAKHRADAAGAITMNNPVAISDLKNKAVHVMYCVEYERCFYMRSDDDGQTFTEPREITSAFDSFRKTYNWRVLATGPGHGIALSKTGRLVMPVWLSLGTGKSGHRPSCVATIYSDDAGKTWQAGVIVTGHDGTLDNPSETIATELSDGRVMLNIRHESPPNANAKAGRSTRRAVCVGPDGATGWGKITLHPQLADPVCMASLLSFPNPEVGQRRLLLFINPFNSEDRQRRNLTLRSSDDDGDSWWIAKDIDKGTAGYSDLAGANDGSAVYCFYERGSATQQPRKGVGALTFVRLDRLAVAKPIIDIAP